MKSREYPDLDFVKPKSYTSGRDGWVNVPRVIIVHHTAGSETPHSAEDGAAYDARRTDGTSSHYYVDSNSVVQCVYTWDMAHTARYTGNRIGISYELCGTLQNRAQWLDPASDATLMMAARQMARDAVKYNIPILKLKPQGIANGLRGFCGHGDITAAFPADRGTHTDPGAAFPWDVLLSRVASFAGVELDKQTSTTDQTEDIMSVLPMLQRGASGRPVKKVQALANLWGMGLAEDGTFGPKTESAIRSVQSKTGCSVDGIVGPQTWRTLLTQ